MNKISEYSEQFLALPNDKAHIVLSNGVALDITFDSYVVVAVCKQTPTILFHSIKRFENGQGRNE